MKSKRFYALSGEQMIWTRHENTVPHGICPVAGDEHVRAEWSDGQKAENNAASLNWDRHRIVGNSGEKVLVTHYSTCEPRFPELAKEVEAKAAGSQAIGEFLEWLQEQGIVLAEYHEGTDSLYVATRPRGKLEFIAEFFGIDSKKAEAERQQLLAEFVASQQEANKDGN
jgi:hypothetical protein